MAFLLRINFFPIIFCITTLLSHQTSPEKNYSSLPFDLLEQAKHITNEIKDCNKNEADEGDDKDHVFIKKKIDASKEFDEIKKRVPLQTQMGSAIWAHRIEHPIKNSDILKERQEVIALLAKNPELLAKLKLFLAAITPQIEQTVLEETTDTEVTGKKLYCQSSFVPTSIANTINKSPVLLALWQVVPHFTGLIITLFDPVGHWSGFSDCNHGHGHKDKKSKFTWEALKKYGKKLTVKKALSGLSLTKTTLEGFQGLGYYFIQVHESYKKLFKKAKALQTIITATEKINQLILDNQPLAIIKQAGFEENVQKRACSIKGSYNIGSLAQLQYFLSNKKTTTDLKNILYSIGKADLYVSLATALQENKVALCSYKTGNKPILILKQGISSNKSAQKVANDYQYTQQPTIITGPGGSGKSEYLAMIIANTICAQSLGIIPQAGNSEYNATPLDYIISHSNITDTRGIESTSQAEAGRLKQCNDYLQNNPDAKGIIVFDELLKHSKPQTAETALMSLVSFFNQYPQLIALYSTHFQAVSEMENTQQLSTKTIAAETGDKPTYEIVPGANNSCSIFTQLSNALGEKFVFFYENR